MQDTDDEATNAAAKTIGARDTLGSVWPGLAMVVCIAIAAHAADHFMRAIPDVLTALFTGLVVGNATHKAWTQKGVHLVLRHGLRAAIIALGAGLNLTVVLTLGAKTLLLILSLAVIALSLGIACGRLARLDRSIAVLIGAGTAICGASAILALSPLLRAKPRETAYAITTIFVFNLVALVVLPPFGHQFGITQLRFGTWVGTAVNDTSVVVATGYIYGPIAGGIATLVKLTRTVLLVPLCMVIGLIFGDSDARGSVAVRAWRTTPWFVFGFFALAAANTSRLLPVNVAAGVAQAGSMLLVVVLAAVGLSVDIRDIQRMGVTPLVIGFGLATIMLAISLTLTGLLQIN